MADAAGVYVNTIRPHLHTLETDGVVGTRQRQDRGPGRRVIEYYLVEPLTVGDTDLLAMAELLAAALVRAGVDEEQLRRIGADWGRYVSGRPRVQDPVSLLPRVLARFGYRTAANADGVRLERCLCPWCHPTPP